MSLTTRATYVETDGDGGFCSRLKKKMVESASEIVWL